MTPENELQNKAKATKTLPGPTAPPTVNPGANPPNKKPFEKFLKEPYDPNSPFRYRRPGSNGHAALPPGGAPPYTLNPLENAFAQDQEPPHPAEKLFEIDPIEQLIMKSRIPEDMVIHVHRMLYTAWLWEIPARVNIVRTYCIARIGMNGLGREDYLRGLYNDGRGTREEENALRNA